MLKIRHEFARNNSRRKEEPLTELRSELRKEIRVIMDTRSRSFHIRPDDFYFRKGGGARADLIESEKRDGTRVMHAPLPPSVRMELTPVLGTITDETDGFRMDFFFRVRYPT